MGKDIVTICIPAFNCTGFVEETLNALKRQTSDRWRAVISLDLSEDNSIELCSHLTLGDSRFKLVVQPERLGWTENINFLLQGVDTALYMIHPHDDYLADDYLEKILGFLDQNPNMNSAVGSLKYIKNNKTLNNGGAKTGSVFERLRDYLREPRNGLLFRAVARNDGCLPLLQKHKYESKGVDLVWVMELLIKGSSAVVPDAVYWKRTRKDGLTGKWGGWPLSKRIASVAEYVAIMAELVKKASVSTQERVELLAILYYHVLRYISTAPGYFGRKDFSEAERLVLASLIWARVTGGQPLAPDDIDHLLESKNLASWAGEISRLEGALMQDEGRLNSSAAVEITDINSLILRADSELAQGNCEQARKMYLDISAIAKDDAMKLHLLSKRFQSALMFEDAIVVAKMAMDIEPNSADRRVRLGALLLKAKKDVQAESVFKQAIQLDPRAAGAHYHMALLLLRRDQANKAIEALSTATRLRPDVIKYKTLLEQLQRRALN